MDLSVIIVNYNVKYFLQQALISLQKALQGIDSEYFVVDNNSSDGSAEFIRENFPWVKIIDNKENLGFGRANNQALKLAKGKFLLIINPDVVVGEKSIKTLIEFLNANPKIGAIGPKIVDREGKFELGSRRGFPTPFAAFSKIIGLAALFPKSRYFAKYNLTYIDPDVECEVDSLSGAIMLIRREVYEQVGGFDEDFFMYGEDLDFCYRIKSAGWKIYYLPFAEIIHYKGESTLRSDINTRKAFFDAMHLFVKKHFSARLPVTVFFLQIGIILSNFFDILNRSLSRYKAAIFDLILLNIFLGLGWFIRFGAESVFIPARVTPLLVYNLGWLTIFTLFGVYNRKKGSVIDTIFASLAGMAFIFTFTYFFKQFAFSRFVMLFTGMLTITVIPGWRWLLFKFSSSKGMRIWMKRRTLLVGIDPLTRKIASRAEKDEKFPFNLIGFVEEGAELLGSKITGVEVIGSTHELPQLIQKLSIEEVIFSSGSLSYEEILKHILSFKGKVGYKVIPESALNSANGEVPFLELGFVRKPNLFQRLIEPR